MGATSFITVGSGDTAQKAFTAAVDYSRRRHGNAGYSGTIAEKRDFVMIPATLADVAKLQDLKPWTVAAIKSAAESGKPVLVATVIANALIESYDPRIDDKWGPAGCIHIEGKQYLFFGWAPE